MDLKNPRQNSANFSHNHDCANVLMSKTGRACSHNASDNAACTQRLACAPKGCTTPKVTTISREGKKSRRKMLKVLGASSLALIMGASVLCGVLFAPLNSPHATRSANVTTERALTPEEKLLSGQGLGLDPENDFVVHSTENGLDIKLHLQPTGFGVTSQTNMNAYFYVTMGSYNGTAINWVIVGRNASVTKTSGLFDMSGSQWKINGYTYSSFDKTSPAGNAIDNEYSKDRLKDYLNLSCGVVTSEIPSGCILVMSEVVLGYTNWGGNNYSANYQGSNLQSVLSTYYSSTLGFTSAQKALIQPQTLKTVYSTSNSNYSGLAYTTVTSSSQYLFPFACYKTTSQYSGQNFCIETYFASGSFPGPSGYFLRSGTGNESFRYGFVLYTWNASIAHESDYDPSFSIRPVMVLKL